MFHLALKVLYSLMFVYWFLCSGILSLQPAESPVCPDWTTGLPLQELPERPSYRLMIHPQRINKQPENARAAVLRRSNSHYSGTVDPWSCRLPESGEVFLQRRLGPSHWDHQKNLPAGDWAIRRFVAASGVRKVVLHRIFTWEEQVWRGTLRPYV